MASPTSRRWFDRARFEAAVAARPAYRSDDSAPRASVASVMREHDDSTELLFIERAKKETDPWSGHIAFPGGRVDATDADTQATAARETWEEIGLDLSASAEPIGQVDDLEGPSGSRLITVSHHLWWLDGPRPDLTLNHEVESAFWVPVDHLLDEGRRFQYEYPVRPGMVYPAIDLDGRVLWGLTLRLIVGLFDRLDVPLSYDQPAGDGR